MPTSTSSDTLRGVPLFQAMTERSLDAVAELAEPHEYAAGEQLVVQGEPGETFIVLLEGTATVDQDGRHVRGLGAGDFLGEIALIDGGARTATVTATSPIHALVISCDRFRQLVDTQPGVRLGIFTALAQRLRERAPAASD
jgi:CRP-like cAMP-binding protein